MPDRKADLARINREIQAINEDMKADLRLYREKVLTELEFARIRRDRQADLAAAETRLTDLSTADALAPLIANPALWADLDLDRKRAIIDALMTVKIMPAPRGRPSGWRAGQPYFDPRSVEITWRKSLA